MLTQQRLKELFHYEPTTGLFTRKVQASHRVHVGDIAKYVNREGYVEIVIDYRKYRAQRLAWLYMYGEFPQGKLDHIDRNKVNNKIDNLRPVTNKQNVENVGIRVDNTSGYKGVSWCKAVCKWMAKITHLGVQIYLGYFNTPEEASTAYQAMRDKLFTHHQKKAA